MNIEQLRKRLVEGLKRIHSAESLLLICILVEKLGKSE